MKLTKYLLNASLVERCHICIYDIFEGNLTYAELKCKYSTLEHSKRNAGRLSSVKEMRTGPGSDE